MYVLMFKQERMQTLKLLYVLQTSQPKGKEQIASCMNMNFRHMYLALRNKWFTI